MDSLQLVIFTCISSDNTKKPGCTICEKKKHFVCKTNYYSAYTVISWKTKPHEVNSYMMNAKKNPACRECSMCIYQKKNKGHTISNTWWIETKNFLFGQLPEITDGKHKLENRMLFHLLEQETFQNETSGYLFSVESRTNSVCCWSTFLSCFTFF